MIHMNPKYHLLVAAAALSLNACSTDDTCPEPEIGGYKISFTVAEDTETRTTLEMLETGNFLRWVPTDKVGIYTVGKNGWSVNSNILTTADVNKSPVEFVGTLEQPVSSGDMFYAYYPYNATQSTDPWVKLSIPVEQKQTQEGVYNGESNPLVAVPMELSQDWGNAGHISSVRFRSLGAVVELQLYSSDEALRTESIHSVTFDSYTPLADDFSFDLKRVKVNNELLISTSYGSKVVTTSLEEPAAIPATSGEAARVYLTIGPGQYRGKIVVRTDVAQYIFRLKNTMTFDRAVIKGLPADLAKADRIIPDASIHFEDPEVKRICVENWDTNKDGELSYKEAAAVTDLNNVFKNTNIVSFNEFRYFTGLQRIGSSAFNKCGSLTSITIPDGVASIEGNAFYRCSSLSAFYGKYASADHRCLIDDRYDNILLSFAPAGLTEYTIPDGVTSIGSDVFDGCSNLTSITIPDGVTRIGYNAFSSCSSLTSITIPDGLTTIGVQAFFNCSSLTSINIPKGVTTIGDETFCYCTKLTSINLPDGLTTIGVRAFYNCSSLTSINIPKGVTEIKPYTFYSCSSLTSINLPDGLTTIGDEAFYSCSSLTSINLPDGVTSIGTYVFYGCKNLTSINIPDGVTTIGDSAFFNCSSLTGVITIPQTVSSIGERAFGRCRSLSTFEGKYASADHRCLIQDGALLAFAPAGLTEYTIPDGVTSIGTYVFSSCSSLTSINIPDGVTTIGDWAFNDCSSLKSITIPEGVTSIGESAFRWCNSLESVYCKPTAPPTIGYDKFYGDGIFYETPSSMKIYVPAASVDAYKTAENWSEYASKIFADNN